MQYQQLFLHSVLVSLLLLTTEAEVSKLKYDVKEEIGKTIIVDQSGRGNFTTVQKAIESIPSNNAAWTMIHVKAGIYNEKVNITRDRPKIVLQGESRRTTIIQFGDAGDSIKSSTFSLYADNFVAKDITFKNTYNLKPGKPIIWAPAAMINSDKAAFYRCGFESVQDTLSDIQGRHYFESCYIAGAMDFIWGFGASVYQRCDINVTESLRGRGGVAYITAQGRNSATDNSGFVFKYCVVSGTGPAFLGRAYRQYSRVLFYRTTMSDIIVPKGWSAWNFVGKESSITYAEEGCQGPGANKSKRVPWEKELSLQDLSYLSSVNRFINPEGWIQSQPHI